jgi:hypothetical protein
VARVGRSLPALHLGLLQPDAEIKLLMGFVIGTLMGPLILRVGARCARGHNEEGMLSPTGDPCYGHLCHSVSWAVQL